MSMGENQSGSLIVVMVLGSLQLRILTSSHGVGLLQAPYHLQNILVEKEAEVCLDMNSKPQGLLLRFIYSIDSTKHHHLGPAGAS